MGDAKLVDGFRLLWREAGGHWRHHKSPLAVAEEAEPEPTLAGWLASVGFAEHEKTIAAYLSVSSQLQDLSVGR